MTIEYRDLDFKLINLEDLQYGRYYIKITKSIDSEDLMEIYSTAFNRKSILFFSVYGQSHNSILNKNLNWSEYQMIKIWEKNTLNDNFTIRKNSTYSSTDKSLMFISNTLEDSNNLVWGYEEIVNFNTMEPEFKETSKEYFNAEISIDPDSCVFESKFDNSGAFEYFAVDKFNLNYPPEKSLFNTSEEDIAELKLITGISDSLLEYFMDPRVIPTGPLTIS